MWMVGGYNEPSHHHQQHQHHHQVNVDGGRKLRPLIPRPPAVLSYGGCASSGSTHACNFGVFSLNHHLVGGEQGIGEKNRNNKEEANKINNINGGGEQVVLSTSRWNPTPEQVRTLEDLYRLGTRTPSTDQIQRITAQLRRYGKIEGKNVFYWFQNHKARERQKRRRHIQLNHPPPINPDPNHHHDPIIQTAREERGLASGKHGFEAEDQCASAALQENGIMSMESATAKADRNTEAVSEHRSSKRHVAQSGPCAVTCFFQLDDEMKATWHNLGPLASPTFCYSPNSTTAKTRRFTASLKERAPTTTSTREDEDGGEECATLQLFPLRSHVDSQQEGDGEENSKKRDVCFFEFLPPKIT